MIGNCEVWDRLRNDPGPSPILLEGVPHTGKRTGAREALLDWGVDPCDVLLVDRLDVTTAWGFRSHFATRGVRGLRGAVACLDGSTPEGTGALLKTLEEPPPQARMVLTASRPVPLVVRSRCITFRLRPLAPEEVPVPIAAETPDQAKGPVIQALKAVASGDENLFEASLQGFGEAALGALQRFGMEAWTGRWSTFTPAEGFGLQQDRATLRQIIAACDRGARPRVSARLALQGALHANLA